MKFLLIIFLIISSNLFCRAQLKFFEPSTVTTIGDTTYYELTHKYFYNYFEQEYDSIIGNYKLMIAQPLKQIMAINQLNGKGYFVVKYRNRPFHLYQINDFQINGLGKVYNNIAKETNIIIYQATFKNNKLDGVKLTFNWNTSEIVRISLYRKGKFMKTIYDFYRL